MKTHVINILPHEPDYRFMADDPRPPVHWDTPDGQWVGIYGNEIPNKLGKEVLQYTDEFAYEVWQPDYRADTMYSHRFENGLVHRLFPAHREKEIHGLKLRLRLHAPQLIQYLLEYSQQHPVVVNLNGDLNPLNVAIMKRGKHLPILQTFRGTLHLPKTMIFRPRVNVLASVTYLAKHWEARQAMANVDYVTYQNDQYQKELLQLFQGPKAKVTSGCDFSFWRNEDQGKCRQALGLPLKKPIFLISSLLILRKQVDKVIEVLKELDASYDFMLVISGHGTDTYEQYLRALAQPLLDKDKVRFVGYITGEEARNYYNSADMFINSSFSEGGPVSAMKALACETLVFSTDSGNVAERMRENGSGLLVGQASYAQWKHALARFMDGEPLKKFDRAEAEAHYDWQKIAAKFAEIYRQLAFQYHLGPEASSRSATNPTGHNAGNDFPP